LDDPVRVRGVVRRQSEHAQIFLMAAPFEQAAFRANDQLFVTPFAKAACEQQELPLPTPQFLTGVDVHHSQVGSRS